MPAGALETLPLLKPFLETVRGCSARLKVAVTFLAALIVTRHLPSASTLSQPDHEGASVFEPGAPVRVTTVPRVKIVEQVAPQAMPAGELVTVPLPSPFLTTVSGRVWRSKVAVTDLAAPIVTKHSFSRFTLPQPDQTAAVVFAPGTPTRTTV